MGWLPAAADIPCVVSISMVDTHYNTVLKTILLLAFVWLTGIKIWLLSKTGLQRFGDWIAYLGLAWGGSVFIHWGWFRVWSCWKSSSEPSARFGGSNRTFPGSKCYRDGDILHRLIIGAG